MLSSEVDHPPNSQRFRPIVSVNIDMIACSWQRGEIPLTPVVTSIILGRSSRW